MLLVGGGLGNAVLFSIGQALRRPGSRVVYFAGYKKLIDRYKVEEIEKAADVVIWCCDEAPGFTPAACRTTRSSATSSRRSLLMAAASWASATIPLDRSRPPRRHRLRRHDARGGSRRGTACCAPYLKPEHHAIGSINSPMQCMMKEICAQCLQTHQRPADRGRDRRLLVLQPGPAARSVDFDDLRSRLSQNSVQEKADEAVDRPESGSRWL
ncbi:MAG: hypothetical protein QM757_22655 [Paludibaculum sp.]